MSEGDEMAGEFDRLVRAGVMAGSQVGERLARVRAERDRQAADATREAQRQHQVESDTHRDIARTVHQQAADPRFWEKAGPERIGLTFAAAYEWRDHDPHAAASLAVLGAGLKDHYGIDVEKTLSGTMEHLDVKQLEVVRQVMGPYMTMPADAMTVSGIHRRNGEEELAHALADQSHSRADDATATTERSEASMDRDDAARLEEQGTGRGTQARQDASEHDLIAEAYDRYGAAARDHAAHDQGAAEAVTRRAAAEPYARYRVGDSPDATPLQEEVRIESGQIFPTSARDSMSHGHAARVRVVRDVRQAPGKSQELGR